MSLLVQTPPRLDIVYTGTWFTIKKLPRPRQRKTDRFEVLTAACAVIAQIKWYSPWRCYAVFPAPAIVMEAQCMQEIASFLRQLSATRTPQEGRR